MVKHYQSTEMTVVQGRLGSMQIESLNTYLLVQEIIPVLVIASLVLLQPGEALRLLQQLAVVRCLLLDEAEDRRGCDLELGTGHRV